MEIRLWLSILCVGDIYVSLNVWNIPSVDHKEYSISKLGHSTCFTKPRLMDATQ